MSLPRFGHGNISLIDPLTLNGTVWDPYDGVSVLGGAPPPRRHSNPSPKEGVHVREVTMASAQIDWRETPEAHIFKADLPGLKKEEVKVQVLDGTTLEISGDRKQECTQAGDLYHCMERAHGVFCRRFRLPDNTVPDEVKATVVDGVLTITIPKVQKPKHFVRQIQVS
ncbi:hypothetical protein M758_9G170500 [Ceratodon purpureus]|nr:hypothetical protein M758_9G170500 [Ceratodon purpureus]